MKAQLKYEIITVNMADVSLLQKTEQAQAYCDLNSQRENIPFENSVRTIQGGKYKGTWLHKKLTFLRLQTTREYIQKVLSDSQVGISRLDNSEVTR